MSRLLSTLTLLALLLFATAPASGVMVRDEKTAVPDFFGSSFESASGDEWPATQYSTSRGVDCSYETAGFVDGPNLYAYVKQNPWTKFDPEGLKLKVGSGEKNKIDAYFKKNGVSGYDYKESRATLGNAKPEQIDSITGSARGSGLKGEIIASMIASEREFGFRDLKGIETNVNAREANVNYLIALKATFASRVMGIPPNFPTSSWKQEGKMWGPKNGDWKTALAELRDFDQGRLDCSQPTAFGRMWGEISGGNSKPNPFSPGTQTTTSNPNDWIPGDHGMVRNNNKPPSREDWHVENTVYLGGGKFYANAVGNGVSMQSVIDKTTHANGSSNPNATATIDNIRNHVQVGLEATR